MCIRDRDEGADYTLLIYSMYDVLPAEEEDWISDPWMAKIHPFRDYGDCIIGRGAVNTKGPTAAFFRALMDTITTASHKSYDGFTWLE